MVSGGWGMANSVYKPGDKVPFNGIYCIDHHLHRLMHEATLIEGTRFPLCRKCGNKVRFSLVRCVRAHVLPFRSTEILEEYPEAQIEYAAAVRTFSWSSNFSSVAASPSLSPLTGPARRASSYSPRPAGILKLYCADSRASLSTRVQTEKTPLR
jgi:hypothetical protein